MERKVRKEEGRRILKEVTYWVSVMAVNAVG